MPGLFVDDGEAFPFFGSRRPNIARQYWELPMAGQSKWGYQRRTSKSYSLPFKWQVVAEVEAGEISWKRVQRKYGIQRRSTVLVRLRKHGRLDWRSSHPMKNQLTPERRIRELVTCILSTNRWPFLSIRCHTSVRG